MNLAVLHLFLEYTITVYARGEHLKGRFAVAGRIGRRVRRPNVAFKKYCFKHFGQAVNIAILYHHAHRFAHSSIRDTCKSVLEKWFFSDKRNAVKSTTH